MLPHFMWYLHRLRKNPKLKPSSFREMQNKQLRVMLKHAYENVPFYHRKFNSAKINPSDVKTVDDLYKIPITTRSEIQAASLDEVIARNINRKECIERMTSGSTGVPLTVVLDDKAIDFENAVWVRAYFEDGMKPWHKMIRITQPHNFKPGHWFNHIGLMQIKFISCFDDVKTHLSAIEEYKPDVIRGYASCIQKLANFCKDNPISARPSIVFTSAELLDKEARRTINSVFETELFDFYVSVEFGLMAWECKEHSGYHINSDSSILEFVENGETVAPGERGKIVGTNLFNRAMPLIRYCIGDVGVPSDEQCPCGRALPLMKIFAGRTEEYLTALDGRLIDPTVFFPYPFSAEDMRAVKQYRVIQEKRDKLLIMLALKGDNLSQQVFEKAKKNLRDLFGEEMCVEFQIVKEIEKDPSGKLRRIISHVKANAS